MILLPWLTLVGSTRLLWGQGALWRQTFATSIVPPQISNYGISGSLTASSLAAVLTSMELGRSDYFCDLGCGDAAVLCAARVLVPGMRVAGIDGDADLVETAKRRLRIFDTGSLRPREHIVCDRLESMSLHSIQGVTSIFCFAQSLRGGEETAERVLEVCNALPTLRVAAFVLSAQRSTHPIARFARSAVEDGRAVTLTVTQAGSGAQYRAWVISFDRGGARAATANAAAVNAASATAAPTATAAPAAATAGTVRQRSPRLGRRPAVCTTTTVGTR